MLNRLRGYFHLGLGSIGSLFGIGSAVNGMVNSGSGNNTSGGQSPLQYQPSGQGAADTNWQQMLAQLQGNIGQEQGAVSPALLQSLQQALGVDSSGMTSAANQAGGYAANLAGQTDAYHNLMQNQAGTDYGNQQTLMGMGQNLTGQANNLYGAGNQLYQTSLDPQNALRNQLQQQTTDASRAGTSARGIGMGAQAAGIENQDVSNMLMQWQNQQLGRQATGLQGMQSAYGTAGGMNSQAGNLYNQAGQAGTLGSTDMINALAMANQVPGLLQQSGNIPYNANLTAAQQGTNAANAYTGAVNTGLNQPTGSAMSQVIPYLNYGQGASNNAFGQQQTGLSNMTGALGNLGTLLGNSSGSGGFTGSNSYMPYPNPSAGNTGGSGATSGSGDGYDFGGG